MRQRWFTHVRLLVAHLTRSRRAFSATLTTSGSLPAQLAVVWAPRLHGEPGGPTSITGTARFVPAIFYIASLSFQDALPNDGS
jgi:hypothetical protein